jgi:hypothetical protein
MMDATVEFETFDVIELANEQMIAHGYSKPRNGEDVPDEDAVKQKVYDLVSSRIVSSKEEKSKKSWTQGELYAAVFPNAPGTDKRENKDLLGDQDLAVMDKLQRKVWNLTNPGRAGYVQKRLGQDGGSLILCRASVYRGQDTVSGCFITDNDDLILNDSLQPQIESLVKKADTLRQHADMIGDRRPALEGRMKAALGLGVKRTVAALPSVTDVSTASNGSADTEK